MDGGAAAVGAAAASSVAAPTTSNNAPLRADVFIPCPSRTVSPLRASRASRHYPSPSGFETSAPRPAPYDRGVRASLSTRFVDAVNEARRLHPGTRGPVDAPEMAHLLGVCALVLADGGGEDEAVAALLHDAAEDGGGRQRLELIRFRFGERVAGIVEGCTDSFDSPKPPWRARKEAFVARIRAQRDPGVLLVCLADKL